MTIEKARDMLLDDALQAAITAEGKLIQAERKTRVFAVIGGLTAVLAAFAILRGKHL